MAEHGQSQSGLEVWSISILLNDFRTYRSIACKSVITENKNKEKQLQSLLLFIMPPLVKGKTKQGNLLL